MRGRTLCAKRRNRAAKPIGDGCADPLIVENSAEVMATPLQPAMGHCAGYRRGVTRQLIRGAKRVAGAR